MVFFYDDIDLQLFAEGAGSGAGDGGNGGSAEAAAQPNAPAVDRHGRKPNPLANVKYGLQPTEQKQQEGSQAAADKGAQEQAEPSREEWEELKKGRFAKFYGDDVSSTVQARLKNSKQSEETLGKLRPVLEEIAKKHGKKVDDIDGMVEAFMDDDSLYEEEALRRGISINTAKNIAKLERSNAEMRARQQAEQQQELMQRHIAGLEQQAAELQQMIPDFDLRAELQNERFRRMVSPEGGLRVEDAYFALHHQEMMAGLGREAVQQTKAAISASIQSGAQRPLENGARVTPPVDVRSDPTKFTKQDRQEIRRRLARGEKIYL